MSYFPRPVRFLTAQESPYSPQRPVSTSAVVSSYASVSLEDLHVHAAQAVAIHGGSEGYFNENDGMEVMSYVLVQLDDGALTQVNAASCWVSLHPLSPVFADSVPAPGKLWAGR